MSWSGTYAGWVGQRSKGNPGAPGDQAGVYIDEASDVVLSGHRDSKHPTALASWSLRRVMLAQVGFQDIAGLHSGDATATGGGRFGFAANTLVEIYESVTAVSIDRFVKPGMANGTPSRSRGRIRGEGADGEAGDAHVSPQSPRAHSMAGVEKRKLFWTAPKIRPASFGELSFSGCVASAHLESMRSGKPSERHSYRRVWTVGGRCRSCRPAFSNRPRPLAPGLNLRENAH